MSYSASVQIIKTDGTADIAPLVTALEAQLENINFVDDEQKTATEEHLVGIRNALAKELLPYIGRDDETLSVSVSGHANADHAPVEGWSNETISVSISVTVPVAK